MILLEVGDKREALDLLRKASQGAADNPAIHFHFAQALAANGETDGAVVELRPLLSKKKSLEERPTHAELMSNMDGRQKTRLRLSFPRGSPRHWIPARQRELA